MYVRAAQPYGASSGGKQSAKSFDWRPLSTGRQVSTLTKLRVHLCRLTYLTYLALVYAGK